MAKACKQDRREKVARRVRDLRRLARGTPSQAEAQAAESLAARLVEEYGLTEVEIPPVEEPPRAVQVPQEPQTAIEVPLAGPTSLDGLLGRLAVQAGAWWIREAYGVDLSGMADRACEEMLGACKTPEERAVAEKVRQRIKEWI
jgi:hypothetical protein